MWHEKLRQLMGLLDLAPGRKTWEKIAIILGQVSRRKPYSRRYVLSVWTGTLEPGRPFANALEKSIRLAEGRGQRIGFVEERVCKTEDCFAIFTPNVPWRYRCYICRPQKIKGE